MRLSAKAQYACVAMVELAGNHGQTPLILKGVSDKYAIPYQFLVQTLLQLKGVGLVESQRGAAGGYQLTKPPAEITVADIILAIDVPDPQSAALASLHSSPAVQAVAGMVAELQAHELKHMEEITLADLVRQTEPFGR